MRPTISEVPLTDTDLRFAKPLYTVSEAASYVAVPRSTFASWVHGYVRRSDDGRTVVGDPVLSSVEVDAGHLSVSFAGLVEGMVLAAIRKSGVPMQRIRPALLALQAEFGIEHALASRRLYSDGAELLYDFATNEAGGPSWNVGQLVVLRTGQCVFTEVVAEYLNRIEYAKDGYARLVHLPEYRDRQVVADPTRSFGQPIFVHGAARVADVLGRFQAGESLQEVADDYGVPLPDLEDAVRVASRRAA